MLKKNKILVCCIRIDESFKTAATYKFMKGLINGGAGFIGFHLCKKFVSKGFKVDLVDNFKRGIIDFELKKISVFASS